MSKIHLLNSICLRSLLVAASMVSAPALAQELAENAPAETAPVENDLIVVTGSRIHRPNLTSNVPVSSMQVEEVTATGDLSVGDALTELPTIRPTMTNASSGRNLTTAGLSLLDLRGLGTTRTLVLVNGRRHITSQAGTFGVDINTVPTDLIDRIDIVTGGNSAIYGSDAVAGVVNFVLKRDFEGIRLRGQTGLSDDNDRGSYSLNLTAGKNFADNRGNIAVNLEYSKQNTLYFTDRDNQTGAFSGRSLFNNTEITGPNLNPSAGPIRTGAEAAIGNGIPDTTFLTGVRNNNISEGGLYTAACPTAAATGESEAAFLARRAAACSGVPNPASSNALAQLGRTYVFMPDGTLVANPCVQDLRQYSATTCIGGYGSTLRRTGLLQPGVERKMGNLVASFEVSPAFRPFIEAKYVSVNALRNGQPSFFNNSFSIDNPFLTDQARAAISSTLAPGQTTFSALRFNVDFGSIGANIERNTYRIVAGFDGTFNDDWQYEVAFNYGRLDTNLKTSGNVLMAQYARSINAVRNGAGTIVCGVNADADTTNDDSACVPVNLFGDGQVSQAALDYFGHTSRRKEKAEQYNATAFISGDTSQWFELPGGPVGFAIGAEYRRETAFSTSDPITQQAGATFFSLGPTFDPPAYVVKEAFGEIRIPLLANMPFVHELSIEASGRVSDYNLGSTGTVFAYNVGGTWAPRSDIRFRAGYSQSVRAPTLGDLFTTASPVQAPLGLADPCGQQNINNNPNRVRNCAAASVPTTQTFAVNGVTTTEPFTNRPVSSINGATSGNPDLQEERSRSLTLGLVAQPEFVPGLSVTVDYYDVKIDNAIAVLGVQTILDLCYDDPTGIDNQYCALINRNPNGTFLGQANVNHAGSTVTLATTGNSFVQQPFNFAKTETSGIDFDVSYRTSISPSVDLSLRAVASYVLKRNNFTNINDPTFSNRQKSELGDPTWRGRLSMTLDFGRWDFGYQLQYIGRQTIATEYETQLSHQGRAPTNPDAFPVIWFPEVFYHSFRLGFDVDERFNLYAGVDNAFDRLPPYNMVTGDQVTPTGSSPYDNIGRYFYIGATAKF